MTLFTALLLSLPVFLIFAGAVMMFWRELALGTGLQVIGSGCLVIVVLVHVAEAFHLFPWMVGGKKQRRSLS